MTQVTKETVLNALRAFIRQRPGLEFSNYGDVSAYRSEMRSITRDRHHAEALLAAVAWRDSITAEQIIEAARHAYSGRLSLELLADGGVRVDYRAGQYFPTEYRRAVCAVLSAALWSYWRDNMPSSMGKVARGAGPFRYESEGYKLGRKLVPAGDWLRAKAGAELGRPIASRWFN